jgi:DNA-binding transcriptional LysR family regulator
VAGSGDVDPDYRGLNPGGRLTVVKFYDFDGVWHTWAGDFLAACAWILENRDTYRVRTVLAAVNWEVDLGLSEAQVADDDLVIREWREDELAVFSNVPIPKILRPEDLYEFKWVCREEGSQTRKVLQEVFEELGVACRDFNVLSEVSNTTAVLQTVRRSKKDLEHPTASIVSHYAIADEVQNGTLYEARLQGYPMKRKFYIVYHKDNKHNAYVNNTVDFILSGKC